VSDFWPSPESVQYWSSLCTIVGFPVAMGALIFAARQLSLSKRSGSAAAVVTLHEAVRKCWADYVNAPEDKNEFAAGELCNSLEVACSAINDRVFFGKTREVLDLYVLHSLKIIERDDRLRELMLSLLQVPDTFKNIRIVLKRHRSLFRALLTAA
jgi:hypothetical protein